MDGMLGRFKGWLMREQGENGRGANDVIVCRDEHGKLHSTPFHVKFQGGYLKQYFESYFPSKVQCQVNGVLLKDTQMDLDETFSGFFPEEIPDASFFDESTEFGDHQTHQTATVGGQPNGEAMDLADEESKSGIGGDLHDFDQFDVPTVSGRPRALTKSCWPNSKVLQRIAHARQAPTVHQHQHQPDKLEYCVSDQAVEANLYFWGPEMRGKLVAVDVDYLFHTAAAGDSDPLNRSAIKDLVKVFKRIARNSYTFVYGSPTRFMDEINSVRQFLELWGFPAGPVILCPSGEQDFTQRQMCKRFFECSFRDVGSLLCADTRSSFYAGFGQSADDMSLFESLSIPIARRFSMELETDQEGECPQGSGLSSPRSILCNSVADMVELVFPQECQKLSSEFNSFNFWKVPLQAVV